MEFSLKIGHMEFTVSGKDRILFNGACYILVTQTYRSGWSRVNPTLSKVKCKKWIKQGILEQVGVKKYGSAIYPLYKFVREVE